MATSFLLKPRNFDPKNVSFSAPRQIGTSGAKMLYLNYSNESLSIQLPNLMVGWDIKFFEDKPGTGKYQVSLKFNDLGDKKQKEMHDFLENLDKLLIKAGHENRAAWLKLPKASEDPRPAGYLTARKLNPEDFYYAEHFKKFANSLKPTFDSGKPDEDRIIIPLYYEKNLIGNNVENI